MTLLACVTSDPSSPSCGDEGDAEASPRLIHGANFLRETIATFPRRAWRRRRGGKAIQRRREKKQEWGHFLRRWGTIFFSFLVLKEGRTSLVWNKGSISSPVCPSRTNNIRSWGERRGQTRNTWISEMWVKISALKTLTLKLTKGKVTFPLTHWTHPWTHHPGENFLWYRPCQSERYVCTEISETRNRRSLLKNANIIWCPS